jgi:hypothetical protein
VVWTKPTDRGTTYWVVFGAGDDETIEVGRQSYAELTESNTMPAWPEQTGLLFYARMLYFAQRRSGLTPVLGAEE